MPGRIFRTATPRVEDVKAEVLASHMPKVGLVSTFLPASRSIIDLLLFSNITLPA